MSLSIYYFCLVIALPNYTLTKLVVASLMSHMEYCYTVCHPSNIMFKYPNFRSLRCSLV